MYDSFSISYSIGSSALHMRVAKILKTSEKYFQLKHVDMQQQRYDCALFAIAIPSELIDRCSFKEEPAIDTGGPSREFWKLLYYFRL